MLHTRSVLCFALAALFSAVAYSSASAATVRCASEGFEYTRCPADTRGGVQLLEQLSDTTCREGENWGYDRRGIWVDRGCAGKFEFGRRYAANDFYQDYTSREYRRDYGASSAEETVRCESLDNGYKRCPADTRGEVQLLEQLSDTTCREGENWGYDRRGIWVDQGCRGEFVVSSR